MMCKLKVHRSPKGDDYHDLVFTVTCHVDGVQVGALSAWRRDDEQVVAVSSVSINKSYRRRGLGTQMYERAAEVACDSFGLPLASDRSTSRSKYSEGFWKKQLRKKRALCVGDSGSKRCHRAVLTCPAPASLAGRQLRR